MIREKENELFAKWKAELKVPSAFIPDGVVDETLWSHTPKRVLYLLKEVNGGENWDERHYLARYDIEEEYKKTHSPSIDSLARWQLGLNLLWEPDMWKGVSSWQEIDTIAAEPAARTHLLHQLAVVNRKKISGGSTVDWDKFDTYWSDERNRELLKEQLTFYHPDYVICGGTAWALEKLYGKWKWEQTSRGVSYYVFNGVTYIDFCHPDARAPRNIVFYALVDAVKEIEENAAKNIFPLSQLTQYRPQLENGTPFATVVRDEPENGVTVLPVIEYAELAKNILHAFYEITESYAEYSMENLLAAYEHSPFAESVITKVDVGELDLKAVLALMAAVLHMERWDNGTLYSFYYSGKLLECLKRIKRLAEVDSI